MVRREVPSLAESKWRVEPGRSCSFAGSASGTHKVSIHILSCLASFGFGLASTRSWQALLFVPCYSFRPDKRLGKTPVLSCSFVLTSEADSFSRCNFVSLFVHSMYLCFIVIFWAFEIRFPLSASDWSSFYIISYIVLHRFNYYRFRSSPSDRSRYRFRSFSYRNSDLGFVWLSLSGSSFVLFRVLSDLCRKSRDRQTNLCS